MRLEITRADPTGNATALVLTPVRASLRARTASRVMELWDGWAEQVGFLSSAAGYDARLDMMGGEFCGNASMSAAACVAERLGAETLAARLAVSGASGSVNCLVSRSGDGYSGSVSMPLPVCAGYEELGIGGRTLRLFTVRFDGITHVIAPNGALSRAECEAAARLWADRFGADALGVISFDRDSAFMRPLVYVRGTASLVWESACASGTSAVGCMLALTGQDGRAALSQPGGVMGVRASAAGGRVTSLEITGGVRLLGTDTVEV